MAHIFNILNDVILPELNEALTTSGGVVPSGVGGDIVQFTGTSTNPKVFDGGLWYGNELILNDPPAQVIIGDVIDFNHDTLPARNLVGSFNLTSNMQPPIVDGLALVADNTMALICDINGTTTNGTTVLGNFSSGGVIQIIAPNTNGQVGIDAYTNIEIREDLDSHLIQMNGSGILVQSGNGQNIVIDNQFGNLVTPRLLNGIVQADGAGVLSTTNSVPTIGSGNPGDIPQYSGGSPTLTDSNLWYGSIDSSDGVVNTGNFVDFDRISNPNRNVIGYASAPADQMILSAGNNMVISSDYNTENPNATLDIINNSINGTVWLQASNTGGQVNVQAQDNLYIHQTNDNHAIIMNTTDFTISADNGLPLNLTTDGALSIKASSSYGTANQVLTSDGTNASWQDQNRIAQDYCQVSISSVPAGIDWSLISTEIPYDDPNYVSLGVGYSGFNNTYGTSISYDNTTHTFTLTPGRYSLQVNQCIQADNSSGTYFGVLTSGRIVLYNTTGGGHVQVGYNTERFQTSPGMQSAGFLNQFVGLNSVFVVPAGPDQEYQIWACQFPLFAPETGVLINNGSCTFTRLGDN